jgi:hypothetical protein
VGGWAGGRVGGWVGGWCMKRQLEYDRRDDALD